MRRAALLCLLALAAGCRREPPAVRVREARAAAARDTTYGRAASDSAAVSAALFTQDFYEWYAGVDSRLDVALERRPMAFSPAIVAALRADQAAQAGSGDEVVGLDWDPFTASQETCSPYRTGRTTRRGDTVLVAVSGVCDNAEVVAELVRRRGRWVFANFRYPLTRSNLLSDLDTLRQQRAQAAPARGH